MEPVRFEAHEEEEDDRALPVATHTTMTVPTISTIAKRATNQKVSIQEETPCMYVCMYVLSLLSLDGDD